MRFAIFSFLLALLATYAMASSTPLKAVIISYPNETPQSLVDQAMESIEQAGGVITHKYNIIKGFACQAPAAVLESIHSLSTQFAALVEEDGVMHTNGN
ncbi:hypothetical protein BU24DRAFT_462693 [Aaosphaeria arxii CBS 175.79]|uniref:Inhibitor I9 domain-containing protein n=1 Tax=Aaosphaeria arxii CBS 175.79 TaxID=1450172 RepID=A0A6A5XV90_9PLEO|nr:uncharacterized protein BU24DRAFT_462693 [Aaosphaeria arxii CBS 175.79]KAF2016550.1 hypothetical protein BU24DRAFT_462693 [Aaosphaeria arxii CBS 175.79]